MDMPLIEMGMSNFIVMQQSLALKGCSRNLNLWIEINAKIENTQRGEGSEITHLCWYRSSGADSEGAHLQLDTTPATLDAVTDLQKRLEVAEKNCSRYFELYKKYRLRWLEEHHRADILERIETKVNRQRGGDQLDVLKFKCLIV
ncbi:hypothetical protein F4604DRAFT_1680218 [Suillus subluteus]|nr:hypothetical protein F4604DRAFT_1680218 [Suillus subluteus]